MNISATLTLYKTQLDKDYKNVYDDFTNLESYKAFLDTAFPIQTGHSIEIQNIGNKSVIDRNGNFSITISGYNSMDLHDFNYLILNRNPLNSASQYPIYECAFITSIDSKNDSAVRETSECTLNCKLDAWANHYNRIKSNSNSNIAKEEKCTFDAMEDANAKHRFDNSFSPNSFVTKNVFYLSRRCFTVVDHTSASYHNDLRVLWLRVKLDPLKRFIDMSTGQDYQKIVMNGAYLGNPGYLLIPIGIFSNNVPMSYYHRYTIKTGNTNTGALTHEETVNYQQPFLHLPLVGSYMYGADLTFFTPFTYQVEISRVGATLQYWIHEDTTYEDIRLYAYALGASSEFYQDNPPYVFGYGLSQTMTDNFSFISQRRNRNIENLTLGVENPDYTNYSDYTTAFDKILDIDALLYRYPYRRISVLYSGGTIPISSQQQNPYIVFDTFSSLTPSFWLGYYESGGWANNPQKKFYAFNSGSIPTITDKLNEFYTMNENSIFASMMQSIGHGALTIGASMLNGNLGGVISAFHPVIDRAGILGTIADIGNYPSDISQTSSNSFDDIFLQDDIAIIYEEGVSWNRENIRAIAIDNHINGYHVNICLSPTSIRRDIFDVDKYYSINIIGVENEDDRNELNNAFMRGVRRWHISGAGPETVDRVNILKAFNTNVINKYISVLEE